MTKHLRIHTRRSIRLKGYDYSQAGLYFLTICTHKQQQFFGHVVCGKMVLNDVGNIANDCWSQIPLYFPHIKLHEYVVMPNHVHGIVEIMYSSEMVVADRAKDFSPLRNFFLKSTTTL